MCTAWVDYARHCLSVPAQQSIMQKLMEKSQFTLAGRHIISGDDAPHPQRPPSLASAHTQLTQASEASVRREPAAGHAMNVTSVLTDSGVSESAPSASADAQEAWLPDIYHLGSPGLSGTTERCAGAVALTPFFSAPPSVAEDRIFKFDDGELSVGLLEETIHMAWF